MITGEQWIAIALTINAIDNIAARELACDVLNFAFGYTLWCMKQSEHVEGIWYTAPGKDHGRERNSCPLCHAEYIVNTE